MRDSCEPRSEVLRMHGAFHDAPRASDVSVFLSFRGGRLFFPRRRPSFPSSDAPVTTHRLSPGLRSHV